MNDAHWDLETCPTQRDAGIVRSGYHLTVQRLADVLDTLQARLLLLAFSFLSEELAHAWNRNGMAPAALQVIPDSQ